MADATVTVTSIFGTRSVPIHEAPSVNVLQECIARGAVYAAVGSTNLGAYSSVGTMPNGIGRLVRMDSHWLIGACSLVADPEVNFVAIVEHGRFVQADRFFQPGWRLQGWCPELDGIASANSLLTNNAN